MSEILSGGRTNDEDDTAATYFDVTRSAAETQAAFEALLADLSQQDARVADAALDAEVSSLLGRRSPARPAAAGPIRSDVGPPSGRNSPGDDDIGRFDWYAGLVDSVTPMEHQQVVAAAKAVEAGLLAGEKIRSTDGTSLTRRENQELRILVHEGNLAWRLLIESNLRLVFHWSKGVSRSVDPDWAQDAFQVGCLGLIRGLQGWDYRLGFRLSTFVSWHIRQSIQRWRANDILLIRLPVHVWESLERDPNSLNPKVLEATQRAREVLSLDAFDADDESIAWDGGFPEMEWHLDICRIASNILDSLKSQEADILRMRHGFGGIEPMTLDDIGVVYGVTRERIRQIEKKALEKIRSSSLHQSAWTID